MQNPINKEIRHYQEEIYMGLTLRQLICSVIAIGAAVLAYLTLEPVLGRETASWRRSASVFAAGLAATALR